MSSANDEFRTQIAPFLKQHCAECHADGKNKGDFTLDPVLSREAAGGEGTRALERAFQMIRDEEMPPDEEKQPTPDERQAAITELKAYLDAVIDDRGTRYAGPFARRLNREQLQNDLFDTLGIDRTLYGLPPFVEFLPEEGRTDGFDTVGHGLGQSSLLLGQYQEFVDHYLALATDDYPAPQRWRFKFGSRYLADDQTEFEGLGHRTYAYKHNRKEGESNYSVPAFDLTWQLERKSQSPHAGEAETEKAFHSFFPNAADEWNRARLELERGGGLPFIQEDSLTISGRIGMRIRNTPLSVDSSGRYKVRMRCRLRFTDGVQPVPVHARYFNRSYQFGFSHFARDYSEAAVLSFDEDRPRPCFENLDRSVEMTPDQWTVLEFEDFRSTSEVYDATRYGFTFDFRFECDAQPKTRGTPREQPAKNGKPAIIPSMKDLEAHYPFLVEVDYMEVEGPYPVSRALLPDMNETGKSARPTAEACLTDVLPRLCRGPLEKDDLDLHLDIFDRNFARTKDFSVSLRATLCAAFLSPKHLRVRRRAPARCLSIAKAVRSRRSATREPCSASSS